MIKTIQAVNLIVGSVLGPRIVACKMKNSRQNLVLIQDYPFVLNWGLQPSVTCSQVRSLPQKVPQSHIERLLLIHVPHSNQPTLLGYSLRKQCPS